MKLLRLSVIYMVLMATANSQQGWSCLNPGEKIHIIAPGYGAQDGSLVKARENIEKAGFSAEIPERMLNLDALGYSNSLAYRAHHLRDVLSCEHTKVVWALRGGRGSSAILPYLRDLPDTLAPKLIVGFSDITALHLWAVARNWPSLHGITLDFNRNSNTVVNGCSSIAETMAILNGEVKEINYKLEPINQAARAETILQGPIVGGNLYLIQRSIGTETNLQAAGKILLLEDVDEAATRLNEAFVHLERAGMFEGIKAIIWGNFMPSEEEMDKYHLVRNAFTERMDALHIPVVHTLNFGHGPLNHPLPLNTSPVLTLGSEEITLTVKTNN